MFPIDYIHYVFILSPSFKDFFRPPIYNLQLAPAAFIIGGGVICSSTTVLFHRPGKILNMSRRIPAVWATTFLVQWWCPSGGRCSGCELFCWLLVIFLLLFGSLGKFRATLKKTILATIETYSPENLFYITKFCMFVELQDLSR